MSSGALGYYKESLIAFYVKHPRLTKRGMKGTLYRELNKIIYKMKR